MPEKLLNRVDGVEEEYQDHTEWDKAKIRQQVTEAVEPERSESEDEPEGRDLLLIERLAKFGEDSTVVADVTASVKRAEAIFQHFRNWASKTPTGYVVKDNLKRLLETATGESLAGKQVYCACRTLQKWSKGAIAFKKTRRHGWMLVAETDGRMSSVVRG